MEDQGLSNSKKYFFIKLKEDIKILYKRFKFFIPLILIYKFFIKIPGFFVKKQKFDKNFIREKSKLV